MKRFLISIVMLSILLGMSACTADVPPETTATTAAPTTEPTTVPTTTAPPEPRDVYHTITGQMPSDITMDISVTTEVKVADSRFTSFSKQTVTYYGLGTDGFSAQAAEDLSFNNYSVSYAETFIDGTMYAEIDEVKYACSMSAEDYASRYLPVVLLDGDLYETVTLDGDTFTFADPTALEVWLLDDTVEITSAQGKVTVSGEAIVSASYTATYTVGGSTITTTVEQTFSTPEAQPALPEDPDDYTEAEDVDGVKLLDYAYGFMTQAKQFSSSTMVSTQSQAAGMVINTQYHLDSYPTTGNRDYMVETNIYAMDTSGSFEQDMEERFVSGRYSVTVDDGDKSYNTSVTAGIMENYVFEMLTENILNNTYLANASITDLGSLYLVEYTCNEDLPTSICQYFCETYLGQADILDKLASSYQTNKMEYYLALDKYTLLPTACGYLYEGCHTIQGTDCLLIEQLDQSFDLASLTSYDAIYDEPMPDEESAEGATPLLYRVTGPDGEQMWLFGTIHVGDDRTAKLPQELYDALLSSDALAVECDTESFDDAVEEDEVLQNQVSDCYFYSGTTIADHIDTEDLHEDAVKVMKATGNYFYNSEYMKAALWSSSIDNYYLSQGHQLVSEKGLESRLEKIAEENDIPLWEVESSLFQIQMMTGYSDYLQEFQLYSSVYSHGKDSWEGVAELYELWCEGDEAKLIEEMKRETWAFKEEDLEETEDMDEEDLQDLQYIRENLDSINKELEKIYLEYIKSMESDRNAGMLKVAEDYLESGKTVFFAVGLAHLLAEDGLVFTLRDAGYIVELVAYK